MCQIKTERNCQGLETDIYGSDEKAGYDQMLEVSEKWRRNTRQL